MIHNIALVGGGNISETHARAAVETRETRLVAVWGDNQRKAASLAARHGATCHETLDECLAHRPLDVVLIGSPSGLHTEHAGAAARRGLHVLVEKPLDISTARIDALIADCERAGVKLGVFYQDRTAPDIQWLRNVVTSGALGRMIVVAARVRWFRTREYYSESRWRGTWALDGGGALMNQGSHTVDLLLWLLGEPTRVFASTCTAFHDIEVEDTAVACIEFASGALATIEVTTAAYPGFPRRIELTGSEGTVILEGDRIVSADLRGSAVELPAGAGGSDASPGERAVSATVSDVRGHRAILEDFLHAIETGGRPLCDGAEARRSVALIESIYHSARNGEAIVLDSGQSLVLDVDRDRTKT
jgi:predicted dehydrogenase